MNYTVEIKSRLGGMLLYKSKPSKTVEEALIKAKRNSHFAKRNAHTRVLSDGQLIGHHDGFDYYIYMNGVVGTSTGEHFLKDLQYAVAAKEDR